MEIARVCGHSFIPGFMRQGDVVLDCGANKGDFSRWVADQFSFSRVYAFEPDPRLFPTLPEGRNLRKVDFAVTGDGGEISLWLGENNCSSAYYSEHDGQAQVRVKSKTLDDFCALEGIERIGLIKLDIEGAELDVLENVSEELLNRVGQITVEFHDFLRKSDEARIAKCSSRMKTIGFHRIRFSWFDQSDVLFVNKTIHRMGVKEILALRIAKYKSGIARYVERVIKK